ncbi:MAG TPA: MBL fold metallo-hydrolase [Tissierellaceae bacterium]|nr:MBL fold metallo-hydrolase [Tissierellaceae bacterium]
MEVIRIPAGIYAANCYVLFSKNTKDGIIVDPGGNPEDILREIEENNVKVNYILLTHGHADHIGGVEELKDNLDIPVLIHKNDEIMIKDPEINLSAMMAMGPISITADKVLQEGDTIEFGEIKGEVIHTPGHTKGGICVKFDEYLITGDTLFSGSIGRTDLRGGSHEEIIRSIKEKLMILDDNLITLPGHGTPSTILNEKRSNPFVQ